jgi:hypothetical protein
MVGPDGCLNAQRRESILGPIRLSVHASHEALTLPLPVANPRSPWLTMSVKVSSEQILFLLPCQKGSVKGEKGMPKGWTITTEEKD